MNNINIVNNTGKRFNVTVNEKNNGIEIVIGTNDFKLPVVKFPGDVFLDKDGDEYIFLYRLENGDVAVLRKEPLIKMKFSEKNNNYNGCKIDKCLCDAYLPELERKFGRDNIVEHEVDLLSMDGESDYGKIKRKVGIPTFDTYRYNKKAIKNHIKEWFWLATPNSTPSGCGSGDVQCVDSGGFVVCSWCGNWVPVLPFFVLKSSIFES